MNIGRWSSAAMLLSGVAGIVAPDKVLDALDLTATSPRGVAEARIGLGGTYGGLGAWALLSDKPAARRAVGVTWLAAGLVRIATLRHDRSDTDWTFWAYLVGEVGLGAAGLLAGAARG